MKKKNFKLLIISIRRNLLSIIFVLFTFLLVIFSNTNLSATKDGLLLWVNSVVPSLFPFFIATELLSHTNTIYILGNLLNFLMRPIFNVPGEGAFPFIMGIISGYPTGAKIVTNLKKRNLCTNIEAERLLAFTNNSGPLFIIGTIGISLFGNIEIGILLFITHILACISVGIVFRFWKFRKSDIDKKYTNSTFKNNIRTNNTFSDLGKILSESIITSFNTLINIGGFVILFSVIISIIRNSGILDLMCNLLNPFLHLFNIDSEFSIGIISGLIELTNGIKIISSISVKAISVNIIICSFILGFGGISVVLQVLSIISEENISIKPYIIGKLLQGIFAAIYTYLFITNFDYFNLNL